MLSYYLDLFAFSCNFHSSIERGFDGLDFPIASELLSSMNLSQMREMKTNSFCLIPILTTYPTILYAGSAHHLAFCAHSVSNRLIIMSKPLPLLARRLACTNYSSGVFSILERTMPSLGSVPATLVQWVRKCVINEENLSTYRGASMIHKMVSIYIEKINAMNLAICLGFKIWLCKT